MSMHNFGQIGEVLQLLMSVLVNEHDPDVVVPEDDQQLVRVLRRELHHHCSRRHLMLLSHLLRFDFPKNNVMVGQTGSKNGGVERVPGD